MADPSLEQQVFGILFEHGSEAVFTAHRESGAVLLANGRLEELLGRSRHALRDSHTSELFAVDKNPEDWAQRILSRAGLHEEVPLRRIDDYPVYVTLTVAHIEHDRCGPLAACIARDTTERRKLERELISKHGALIAAHAELEQAFASLRETQDRLEVRNRELSVLGAQLAQSAHRAAIGEFSAGIAHSMNNPMGAALSALRQIRKRIDRCKDSEFAGSIERFVTRSESALGRMESIVSTIRSAHRSGNLDSVHRSLDLESEIETALALFEDRLQSIEVVRDFPSDCNAWGPSDALHHVLSNLIDNAIRAMNENGQLRLRIRRNENMVVVAIEDTGGGVPVEIVDKLFDPFFSARADGSGTGLGLCLAQRLARQWGGDVQYRAIEHGARFEVMIPGKE